jgi:aryl-alcohol dehydrogenase
MPAVVGHEERVSSRKSAPEGDVKQGDRVIISWPACGHCQNCLTGKRYACELMFPLAFGGCRLDGSRTVMLDGQPISACYFQQSSLPPTRWSRRFAGQGRDESVPWEIMAALPCGALTGAGAVLNSCAWAPRTACWSLG